MRRLFRLLATLVVLLGMIPCELREALPILGGLASPCCADDAGEHADAGDHAHVGEHDDAVGDDDAGEHDDDGADCCDTVACACAAPAVARDPLRLPLHPAGYLLMPPSGQVDRPTWRAGPPPTPPPIA